MKKIPRLTFAFLAALQIHCIASDTAPPFKAKVDKLAATLAEKHRGLEQENLRLEESLKEFLSAHAIDPDFLSFAKSPGTEPAQRSLATLVAESAMRLNGGSETTRKLWKDWSTAPHGDGDKGEVAWLASKIQPDAEDAAGMLGEVVPDNWIYKALLTEHRRLDKRVRDGAASPEPLPMPEGDKIVKPGEPYPAAGDLAERLVAGGYLGEGHPDTGGIFSAELSEGLKKFQSDQGLSDDGIIGPNTLRGLNRNDAAKLALLALNLERARLLPHELGKQNIVVNLPAGRLLGFENGSLGIDMKVIFGKVGNETRLFADQMSYLVFRPYWNIPAGIARDEILPKARGDSSYLASKNYEIVPDFGHEGEAISPTANALAKLESGEFSLRQRPGSSNALGLVKFLFPNEHAIYLHDTPKDGLFSRSQRAFSHGCVRVERPADLATWVLNDQGWNRSKVTDALTGKKNNRHVQLDRPIPVYLVYFTAMPEPASASGSGSSSAVRYYPDVYQRDRPAMKKLQVGVGESAH